ncbi:zeta-sarcoglycan [Ochlerotatus camptorhynchus]|uniref:zeta-sarcoglycan n=1 Tax=Ochlerotatus camptorhynchus TaxID=644619 RepID=UPI0031DBBDBE
MSYYLRDGPRSVFFNPPPQDSNTRSETEPLQRQTVEPEGSGTSNSSSLDKGRMFKRPLYGPNTSTLSGIGNSKPVASSLGAASLLYPSQPPRIIGSTSANFGAPGNKLFTEPDVTANSLKIAFRPSPTSSTATTTPSSTAPGSGTHQPVETQMPANRNSGSSALGGNAIPNSSANNNFVHSSTSAGNNVHHSGNVVNSYGGDSGGGRNAALVTTVPQHGAVTPSSDAAGVQLTLYGWRKKCLYSVILILMIMIIINLALTLWILKVMEFSSDGMGQLKIVSGGIQLTGQAMVLDILRASSIRSKHGQPISIESSRNFSVNTRDFEGYLENQLFLGHDRLEVLANHFRVSDAHGTSLFAVDRDEVSIGASSLRVEGEGGVIFKDSIQTPLVRAEAGKDLKLESPTRSLEVRATQEIFMQSRAGSIEANCLNDLKLHSVAGSIRLDASSIIMPNLRTVQAPSSSSSGSSRDHGSSSSTSSSSSSSSHSKIYQLCACSNGKLFLAPAHSICTADDSAICR